MEKTIERTWIRCGVTAFLDGIHGITILYVCSGLNLQSKNEEQTERETKKETKKETKRSLWFLEMSVNVLCSFRSYRRSHSQLF